MKTSAVVGLFITVVVVGCQGRTSWRLGDDNSIDLPGLANVIRLSVHLYSGSSPEGTDGFQSLRRLGVRTVVTVDGARPEVELARQVGLRYVHLPVGYDGIPRERVLQLARAVRDLPGPVYVHCHHGKHRGPTAAIAVQMCLDSQCSVEQAEAFLKRAGTDPHYAGLIGLPRNLVRPTVAELDGVVADFPEVAAVPDLARLMVEVDCRCDRLKAIAATSWRSPPNQPDLDPAHEVRLLAEQYSESLRLGLSERPDELRQWLATAHENVLELEKLLRPPAGIKDSAELDRGFRQVRADCTRCHAKYRDKPRSPTDGNGP
jgi:protein tyrosine phosphatase (PTP) superfamily phosphohydrolase (DUF442 family)